MTAAQSFPPAPLPLITGTSHIHEAVLMDCKQLYFRQSMLNDYMTCPQMSLYGWVLSMEQAPPFMSAILGTAGHQCIYNMHLKRRFDFTAMELLQDLDVAFDQELARLDKMPLIGQAYDSIIEEKAAKLPAYVEFLLGYQKAEAASQEKFYSTMHEQSFVLEVRDSKNPGDPPYLFTGQIDQGGFNQNGHLVLRDIKFRDNAFKPGRTEFDLNMQMTIYAAAMKHGYPACRACAPKYREDDLINMDKVLDYSGPCESCKRKMGTEAWPMQYPVKCIMIWMKDFTQHDKDQYEAEVLDRTLPKIPNPKGKGPKVYQRVPNPLYHTGYKKGDPKGQGYLVTNRTPRDIEILMGDILAACRNMREGKFYRQPGKHCGFWCKHVEQCAAGIETSVKESAIRDDSQWRDPFDSP